MKICFNEEIGRVACDVSFQDKLCIFTGKSGEGKTFLFSLLKEYLKSKKVSCKYFDYDREDDSIVSLKEECIGRSVIIFDNADLYLTQELLDHALRNSDILIVSMKDVFSLNLGVYSLYSVEYDKRQLIVGREWN